MNLISSSVVAVQERTVSRSVFHNIYVPQVLGAQSEPEMLRSVNVYRSEHGLLPLVLHPGLTKAAQGWAEQMRDTGVFEHGDWAGRILPHYPNWMTIGENIAAGYLNAQAAVDAWMDSPGHRRNILNPDFEEAGIGYAEGGTYQRWYVMDYGARFKAR